MTATQAVTHNSDGSKSVTISSSGSISGASLSVTSCSGTVALTTIPRASKPSIRTRPTTTTNIGTFGETVTIYTNRKSSSFTHEISYKFSGESSETIIGSSVGTSISWKIPDKSALIPTKTAINGTVYCQTKNGSTKIGSKQSVAFTVKIDTAAAAPEIGDVSISITDGDTNRIFDASNFSGQYFIKGITSFKANATPAANLSAAIKTVEGFYSQSKGVKTTTENGIYAFSGGNMASPDRPVGFKVTDSRGLTASKSVTMNAVSYIKPTCGLSNAAAQIDDSGTKFSVEITASGDMYSGSFGNKQNAVNVEYAIRQVGGSWGTWTAFSAVPTTSGNKYSVAQTLTNLDYQAVYEVKARVKDLVYTSGKESSVIAVSAIPPFYWNDKEFHFNAKTHFDGGCDAVRSDSVTTNALTTTGEVEIYGSTPHVDMHFGNSTSDYTTRIIETASGKLNVMAPNGVLINGEQIGGWETVSLTVVSSRLTNTNITAKYNPILGMLFVRIYGKANATLSTGSDYDLLNIPSGYRPGAITALAIKCSANAHACAKSSGVISIRPFAQITTHDIYISGFWFV